MRGDHYRKYPQPTPWWVYALLILVIIVATVAVVSR